MSFIRLIRIIQCLCVKINNFFREENSSGRIGLTRLFILVNEFHKLKRPPAALVGALPP